MRRAILATSVLAGMLLAIPVFAADHLDSPSVAGDAATDITDVYAWMNDDGTHVNLILNVAPFASSGATFSDAAQYVWHVESGAQFGATTATKLVLAQFDANGNIELWVGNDRYLAGDASVAGGIGDDSVRVYTGLRNDPFFFNLEGFNDAAAFVAANAGGLTFDNDGCPALDSATATEILLRLTSTADGTEPAEDTLAGSNVLSIVVRVDKNLLNSGGDLVSVWGSTNTR